MKEQSAFSLIELLVVIAIVGILAGIAVPAYEAYREKVKYSDARQQVNNIYVAIEDYRSNNSEDFPTTPSNGGAGNSRSDEFSSITNFPISNILDPWDTPYFVDGCINSGGGSNNCTTGGLESGPYGLAICSAGPDGSYDNWNNAPSGNEDDICIYFNNGFRYNF